jgi:hypothetical protein
MNTQTTQPPKQRERLTLAQFEQLIREQGEAQARLRNIQEQRPGR